MGYLVITGACIVSFIGGIVVFLLLMRRRLVLVFNAGYTSGWSEGRADLIAYLDKAMGVDLSLDENDTAVKRGE